MSRQSANETCRETGRLLNGYDYDNQCWVLGGVYIKCGHPAVMDCGCYGRQHAGEMTVFKSEVDPQ